MKYKGSCHCGRVSFEGEGEIKGALACNCSMCQRKGSLLWFVPRGDFRLVSPEEAAGTYTFNKHVIKHRFCPVCGIHVYGEGVDQRVKQWLRSISGASKISTWRPSQYSTLTVARARRR
jgi:hypothetical protein